MLDLIASSLVLGGVAIQGLAAWLICRLIKALPQGRLRGEWALLLGLVGFFILGYLGYLASFSGRHASALDLIVPAIFFMGAGFVALARRRAGLRPAARPCRVFFYLTSQEMAMDKVSVYDGKARFSELVERAESGRATVITKRGRVVAKIVPAQAPKWDRAAVLDEAEAFRKRVKIKRPIDLGKLIGEGRR